MSVRIPYLPRKEHARPLQNAIDVAAAETEVHPAMVAIIFNHVLEQIAEEVAQGNVVRIPGFGIFATTTYRPAYNGLGRAIPAFSASRGFRNITNLYSSGSNTNQAAIRNHRANNCLGDWSEDPERYAKAMEKQRQCYRKQYREAQLSLSWRLKEQLRSSMARTA